MNIKSKVVSIIGAGLIMVGSIAGAAAQQATSVNVTVQTQSGGLNIVQVQQSSQFGHVSSTLNSGGEATGGLTVTLEDARYTRVGWSLNISATDFVGQGNSRNTLPASSMAINSVVVTKQIGDPAPPATVQNLTMSSQVTKVVSAAQGGGSGRYDVALTTRVTVPANTSADTYKSTVTFTLDAAP